MAVKEDLSRVVGVGEIYVRDEIENGEVEKVATILPENK